MTFSNDAWDRNAALYETIRTMPFNRELAAGTLSNKKFQQYIIQDSHYLMAYARVYAMASAKADTNELVITMADWAAGTMRAELSLHEHYFEEFGLDPVTALDVEPTPTCRGYTDYLLATGAMAPLEVVVAALLPCLWVYWEVGCSIAEDSIAKNPFAAWIDTYSAPGFGEKCALGRADADRLAEAASPIVREQMHEAFHRAMQLEWMFWDAAWRQETWPVS
ncbi:MAG: thiaminase II [Alphaproteobacteria bacterium]|jgi:thiaminase (transcriptional activator TenA)|nr:thiaminase II [Rhodospirillaceae bacterium]MDG2482008.1 thiaminase II [Alphaproteobacteria bacterium]MBT6203826.1 thiaminase II [Rhodospirillaceae bacterium]MBT6510892.1 thiaminase II [Rhodospirillaceae bacterium]MBT7612384.1 thiaminase II [Rhodospirillaceae bacterium]